MTCPRCGRSLLSSDRCAGCGAVVDGGLTVAGVMDPDATGLPPGVTLGSLGNADTTGLPPGATFGSLGNAVTVSAVTHDGGVMNPDTTGLPPGVTFGSLGNAVTVGAVTHHAGAIAPAAGGPLTVGQGLGPRYHIIKLLGAGGMGAVYQAWDAELGVAVALKVIRVDSRRAVTPEAEKRFKQELLLARQVTHKNVVRIHDLGEIDGIKYITMPFVKGHDLSSLLRKDGKLPIPTAMRLARDIAAGLQAAHDAGVVHRDLKPANIMVTTEKESLHALIMDFGISASADAGSSDTVVGTLEYMAPEQAKGTADARADIYAFGLILYEMLTGPRSPESASPQTRFEAMQKRFDDGLPALRSVDSSIPEVLEAFVMKCLATDPAARFCDTRALNTALAAIDDSGRRIRVAARLTKRLGAAAIAVVLVLVAGAFYIATRIMAPVKPHDPVTVMIADFENHTGDPALGNTVRATARRALEGATFISAYDRATTSRLGAKPPEKLDSLSTRQFALKQGLGVVIVGSIQPRGGGYDISTTASETVSGKELASVTGRASGKDEILATVTKVMAKVRKALGDRTSESAQLFAMRSLSASSPDVVAYYAAAIEAQSAGKMEDAKQAFLKAVQLDPKFGLGYQGLAVVSSNLGRNADAEKYIKQALQYLDSMSERERLGTRGYYDRLVNDNQQCVAEYGELLARYPADVTAHNQRAVCLYGLRKFREAADEVQYAVRMLPNYVPLRINLALLKNLTGDFQGAEDDVKAIPNPDVNALQELAYSQTGRGLVGDAAATYEKMRAMGPVGASTTAAGLGDLAIYEGRFAEAVRILGNAAAADRTTGNSDKAAIKLTGVAYAQLLAGDNRAAIAGAEEALANSQSLAVRFMSARILAEAGAFDKARPVAAALAAELPAEPQAHGKILQGLIALKSGNPRQAISDLTAANTLLNTWFGHFDLGRAYLAYGALPQADSELDLCLARRGEALTLVDEGPTYGYFPLVYYYRGRTREALKTASFADSYREYLKIRGTSTEDPLVRELRKFLH